MTSGCGDTLSLADLQAAKKHQIFEAEVITGKQGGIAGGAGIETATNPVTLQVQKTLPAILRDAGFRSASFDFSSGGTLGVNDRDLAVMWPAPGGNGLYYSWHGALPKTIPAGSSPASTGGESDTAWKLVGDLGLRAELASDTGYLLVPSVQIQTWQKLGDIRGWGAVCDGVTDDLAAINTAITATDGSISIPADTLVSSHVLISGKTAPRVTFLNGAKLVINTNFIFAAAYRGILEFHNCSNPSVIDAYIIGAKIDKLIATEPWNDGDAGIEFLDCTGICRSIRPHIEDVKTWGLIHVACKDVEVESPYVKNAQVQSGVGATSCDGVIVTNPTMYDIGLYGVEMETTGETKRGLISGGLIVNSQKAVAIVHNTNNVTVQGVQAYECVRGFNVTTESTLIPGDTANRVTFDGNTTTSCSEAFEIVYTPDARVLNNRVERDTVEFFTRTRAQDRILKFNTATNKAFVFASSVAEFGLAAGNLIRLDNGTQYTVASVDASLSSDPTFGTIIGFTTTTPLTSDCLRRSFKRYREISSSMIGVTLYGGSNNYFMNNQFNWCTSVILSYAAHTEILWKNNYSHACQALITLGSTGAVTGQFHHDISDSVGLVGFGNAVSKFIPAYTAVRSYRFDNAVNHNDAIKPRQVIMPALSYVGKLKCVVDTGASTTGVPTLIWNGTNAISGMTGSPMKGSATLAVGISSNDVAQVQLTDTVGDFNFSGYTVEVRGIFRE